MIYQALFCFISAMIKINVKLLVIVMLVWGCSEPSENERLTYLKKGNGKKIEPQSWVKYDLITSFGTDSILSNTFNDSIENIIQINRVRMKGGIEELFLELSEGDSVIARKVLAEKFSDPEKGREGLDVRLKIHQVWGPQEYVIFKDSVDNYYHQKDSISIFEYAEANNIELEEIGKGTYLHRLKPGINSKKPSFGDLLEISFSCFTLDDVLFDTSGENTETVAFGVTQLVQGFSTGLGEMTEGESATIFCTSGVAWGNQRVSSSIKSYTPVKFDVQIHSIVDGEIKRK